MTALLGLGLGFVLFALGAGAVLLRRSAILIFLGIELMLNAANLTFVTFSHMTGSVEGQVAVIFTIAVAAAEAGVGLALFILLFRKFKTQNVDDLRILRW